MTARLRDLLPPPVGLPMGTGTMEVKGLNLTQIVIVLQKYKEKVLPFFQGGEVDYADLVISAPDMVAEMIALSADAVGQEEDIKLFPFAEQVNAMAEVWKLSVPDLKKLVESLSGVAATLGRSASPVNSTLKNISPSVPTLSSAEATAFLTSVATP